MVVGKINPESVDVVIFDMMHTLFARGNRQKEAEYWAILISQQFCRQISAAMISDVLSKHEIIAGVGGVTAAEWIQAILKDIGIDSSAERAEGLSYALGRITAVNGNLYPGVKSLFKDIHASNRQIAILSTVGYQGRMVAEVHGLEPPLVDQAFFSNEIGLTKDAKDYGDAAYIRVAEEMRVSPSKCLFVDDHLEYVQSAKNLGMQAVAVLHDGGQSHSLMQDEKLNRSTLHDEGIPTIDKITELRELLQLY